MLKFTLADGSMLHVAGTATLITNKGPALASAVFIGALIRCGTGMFCAVTNIDNI